MNNPAPQRLITVYRPDSRLRANFIEAAASVAGDAFANRWHIWTKFKHEFRARSNQTGFGAAWLVIEPVIPISAYAFLALIAVFPSRDDMPAVLYISIGVTVWTLMTDAVMKPMGAVLGNRTVLSKSNFPLAGILFSGFAQTAFDAGVRILCVAAVFAFTIGAPPWRAIFIVPMLIPILIFSMGLGMGLSIINVVYRDLQNIMQIVLRYGLFLSLVIFPLPAHPMLDQAMAFNPFAVFIDNIRSVLVFGELSDLQPFLWWSAASLLALFVGCKLVYVMEHRIRGFL